MESGTSENLIAVAGTGPRNVYAVLSGSDLLHFDGDVWKIVYNPGGIGGPFHGICAQPKSDVLVVGSQGTILRGRR
jgi:hypothetical protein